MKIRLSSASRRSRVLKGITGATLVAAMSYMVTDPGYSVSLAKNSAADAELVLWGARALSIVAVEKADFVPTTNNPPKQFTNITDISANSGHISVVALEGGLQSAPMFSLYEWFPTGNTVALKATIRGLVSAQVSSDGELGAFVICGAEACDVQVRKLSTGEQLAVWPGLVTRTAEVSWFVVGKVLLVDGADGWIKTATIADHSISNIVKGSSPAISPSGTELAYVYENKIRIRSLATGEERNLHSSLFQRHIGRIHWRNDNSQVLANRVAGMLGYDTECLVIDVRDGRTKAFRNGGLWCGPWFELPRN